MRVESTLPHSMAREDPSDRMAFDLWFGQTEGTDLLKLWSKSCDAEGNSKYEHRACLRKKKGWVGRKSERRLELGVGRGVARSYSRLTATPALNQVSLVLKVKASDLSVHPPGPHVARLEVLPRGRPHVQALLPLLPPKLAATRFTIQSPDFCR